MCRVTSDKRPIVARAAFSCHLSPATRHSEKGIALIITLILLSVTLIMAVAFLAISRRERGSVVTSTDAATARLAADAALAHAEAQIIANVFATTNPYNYGLLVSTNYQNSYGYVPNSQSPTNVNYDYRSDGTALNVQDFLQNVANLYYLPRPPVFVPTNSLGSNEFRFYLDLNRNGKFEDSGNVINFEIQNGVTVSNGTVSEIGDPQWIGVLERPDAPHGPNNKFLSRYAFIALPVGNELDLNYIHNQALHGNITNGVSGEVNPPPAGDVFFRNQGVGSWEINLAAFLADLNTNVNEWGNDIGLTANYYRYNELGGIANQGNAFDDARALLAYRYNNTFGSLVSFSTLFPNYSLPGSVDIFPLGAAMTGTAVPFYNYSLNNLWPGVDSPNHFFALTSDLFDTNKNSAAFNNRLLTAANGTSTYDRYTFYRMLAQLGTDSAAESGKMNLNYDNLDVPRFHNIPVVNGPPATTNFLAWTPIDFFTNAADRMLRLYTTNWFQGSASGFFTNYTTVTNWYYTAPSNYLATYYGLHTNYFSYVDEQGRYIWNAPSGFGLTNVPYFGITNQVPAFGITNIPVYVNGQFVYSSAIQRVLQLAANIYDATTNNTFAQGYDFPSVFRPTFWVTNQLGYKNVYVLGFNQVTSISEADQPLSEPYDLKNPTVLASLTQGAYNINVFGVPLVIGAKKNLPNFNQLAIQSLFQITRKLQLTRTSTNILVAPVKSYKLNQQLDLGSANSSGVANQLEVECWNSYFTNYTRSTDIYVTNWMTMNLTNDEGFNTISNLVLSGSTNITQWPGYNPNTPLPSFFIPLNTNAIFVPTNSVYRFNPGGVPYLTSDPSQLGIFESNVVINGSSYPQPHWGLIVTNNIQVAMVDHATGRLIDYVQLSGPNSTRDITAEISQTNISMLWQTNYVPSKVLPPARLPFGIEIQLEESEIGKYWDQNSASGFNNFVYNGNDGQPHGATNLQMEAYSPPTTVYQTTTWQANDPLVHYMAADLFDSANDASAKILPISSIITPGSKTVFPNERYQPWGISKQMAAEVSPDASAFNLALKDPLIWSSDHWDFPTYKFPTVGWLGRVHRGTPWQTVYLKASNILKPNGTNIWINWTGNVNTNDAINAAPLQDRLLFDLFTTAPNDNATRGQLPINVDANANDSVSGLAAWSALFSGVMVLSNNLPDGLQLRTYHTYYPLSNAPSFTAFPINPAGANLASSALWQMVTNINSARTNFANFDGANNAFEHVGDILSARQLTEQSPFLNLSTPSQLTNGISDEMYEWLPQQAMSLLRTGNENGGPRYVIYCYGQTLKPAPNGIVTGSMQFGMVTNYQVVAETATRAVVQFRPTVTTDASGTHTNYNATVEQFNPLPPD